VDVNENPFVSNDLAEYYGILAKLSRTTPADSVPRATPTESTGTRRPNEKPRPVMPGGAVFRETLARIR
jgi:hypothetical protein